MKNYYYCKNNQAIYTEKEKIKSVWDSCRFEKIGEFKSRREAEAAFMAGKTPFDENFVIDAKRI